MVLAVLVAVFGPVEWRGTRRRRRPATVSWASGRVKRAAGTLTGARSEVVTRALGRPAARAGLTVGAFAAVILGLLGNSMTPKDVPQPLGLPTAALVGYLAGAAVLRLLRAAGQRSTE